MNDLTVIMLTANKVPAGWAAYHREVLTEAIGDAPIITISSQPLDWGINLIQDGYSVTNLFSQILRGAETATTPFVAIAEDDTLYPASHFEFRPPHGTFGYNFNRWQAFTWERRPYYFHKPYPANGMMIAWREHLIDAIRFRLAGPLPLRSYRARELGANPRTQLGDGGTMVSWYSREPVVALVHPYSVDNLSQRRRKAPWPVRAYDIPHWRKAKWIVGRFA
jgi:hypothetical protein